MIEEFSACGIERTEDIVELFAPRFFFGCEADDPMTTTAFNGAVNPFGARLGALFGSDISHWDVPVMSEVLGESYELIEHGLLSDQDYRDFMFANAVRFYTRTIPGSSTARRWPVRQPPSWPALPAEPDHTGRESLGHFLGVRAPELSRPHRSVGDLSPGAPLSPGSPVATAGRSGKLCVVSDTTDGPPDSVAASGMRASRLIRVRSLWVTVLVVTSVLIVLMSLIYVGSVVDPLEHLHDLPVLVVNDDVGATVGAEHLDIGTQVVSALNRSPAVSSRLSLHSATMAQARSTLDENGAYAVIAIPSNFTVSTLALYGYKVEGAPAASLPTIQLLTNVRAGSIGVSLATGVADPALVAISHVVGSKVAATVPGQPTSSPALVALRKDPFTLATVPYRPLPPHSALGLSAFYISLLAIMCGFLGAILINTAVDAALGYATNEIGPRWRQRPPVNITRWQTLLAKWSMALVVPPILTGLLLIVAIGLLNMDATHIALLWVFLSFGAVVIAMGTLVLFAMFGSLGQLLAMLLFVYLALASSGGTIPLQALPPMLKFAANFEPLRQILDGTRAILYFNASGPAGLTRGFILTAIGLILWLVIGVAITTWYDRRGLHRLQPEILEYWNRSVAAFAAGAEDPPPVP